MNLHAPSSREGGRIRRRNRALILEAAEEVFAAKGFDGATTAEIAARAGLPKANLHYYFATKEAVYRAVIADTLHLWLSLFDHIAPDDDPAEALGGYIRRKMRHSFEHPLPSRIFALEVIRGAPVIHDFLAGELRSWVEERSAGDQGLGRAGPDGGRRAGPSVLHDLGRDPDLCRFRRSDHGRARPRADGRGPGIGDGAVGGPAAAWVRPAAVRSRRRPLARPAILVG